jgi:hypothetical protein
MSTNARVLVGREQYYLWDALEKMMESELISGIEHDLEAMSEDESEVEVEEFAHSRLQGLRAVRRLLRLRADVIARTSISLLDLLYDSDTCLATDERDKVYALLGLTNDGMAFVPEPSYSITLDELFQSMAESITRKSKRLDILFLGAINRDKKRLSWVPDWFAMQDPRTKRWIDHLRYLSASASQAITIPGIKEPLFHGSTLTVRGIRVDAINGLTSGRPSSHGFTQPSEVLLKNPYHPKGLHSTPWILVELLTKGTLFPEEIEI